MPSSRIRKTGPAQVSLIQAERDRLENMLFDVACPHVPMAAVLGFDQMLAKEISDREWDQVRFAEYMSKLANAALALGLKVPQLGDLVMVSIPRVIEPTLIRVQAKPDDSHACILWDELPEQICFYVRCGSPAISHRLSALSESWRWPTADELAGLSEAIKEA